MISCRVSYNLTINTNVPNNLGCLEEDECSHQQSTPVLDNHSHSISATIKDNIGVSVVIYVNSILNYIEPPNTPITKNTRSQWEDNGVKTLTNAKGDVVPNWTSKAGWLEWENQGLPCYYCDKCKETLGKIPKKSCFTTQNRLDNHINKCHS